MKAVANRERDFVSRICKRMPPFYFVTDPAPGFWIIRRRVFPVSSNIFTECIKVCTSYEIQFSASKFKWLIGKGEGKYKKKPWIKLSSCPSVPVERKKSDRINRRIRFESIYVHGVGVGLCIFFFPEGILCELAMQRTSINTTPDSS